MSTPAYNMKKGPGTCYILVLADYPCFAWNEVKLGKKKHPE